MEPLICTCLYIIYQDIGIKIEGRPEMILAAPIDKYIVIQRKYYMVLLIRGTCIYTTPGPSWKLFKKLNWKVL